MLQLSKRSRDQNLGSLWAPHGATTSASLATSQPCRQGQLLHPFKPWFLHLLKGGTEFSDDSLTPLKAEVPRPCSPCSPAHSVSVSRVCRPSPVRKTSTMQGVACLRQGEPHSEKKRFPGNQSLPALILSLSLCMCVYRGSLLEPPAPHHALICP